ncbi:hypothetical protein [Streptomyces sp. NPDC056796]|uniref:hypothetical protein n=1 Tax=Streptomyces sp. NPDC056796 TaxID=3345947 RepID=UPI0036984FEF
MSQTEAQKDQPETLAEVVQRFAEAYAKREAGIGEFHDDEGKLKPDVDHEKYDGHAMEAWCDSHADLGVLLEELKPFVA